MMKLVSRIRKEMRIFFLRNRIQLYYPQLRTVPGRVNLNYCRIGLEKGEDVIPDVEMHNLGDELSAVVVEYMLQKKGLSLDSPVRKTRHLYAIGSILFFGYQDATVWGSGLLTEPSWVRCFARGRLFRMLDIRCVRGPRTAKVMRKAGFQCPDVYGDPGCLMPLIYTPAVEKRLEYVVIPHHSKEEELRKILPAENIVSMATADYKAVIDQICSAKKVISSSLHGIILAEAYGVPAIFYQDRPASFSYKYADWYESTGRTQWPVTSDLREAIAMDVDFVPDLSKMQRDLMESFPYDLWEAT